MRAPQPLGDPGKVLSGDYSLRPGTVVEFPPQTEFHLIRGGRPEVKSPATEVDLISVAARLWVYARVGGKPKFIRLARRLMKDISEKGAETAYELACRRRREAVRIFGAFAEEIQKLWPMR